MASTAVIARPQLADDGRLPRQPLAAPEAVANPAVIRPRVDMPPAIVNTLFRGQAARVRLDGSSVEYDGQVATLAPLPARVTFSEAPLK